MDFDEEQIEHRPAKTRHELQVADAIAWALFQKWSRHNPAFRQIIEERIAAEVLFEVIN